jgi:hypothetical protein
MAFNNRRLHALIDVGTMGYPPLSKKSTILLPLKVEGKDMMGLPI